MPRPWSIGPSPLTAGLEPIRPRRREPRRSARSDGPMDHRGTRQLEPLVRQLPKVPTALDPVDGRTPTLATPTIGGANNQITPTPGDL
jgi:hypothetical protein